METKGFNIEMWKLKNLVKKMEQEERKVIRKMTGSQFLKMLMDGKELYEHWIK